MIAGRRIVSYIPTFPQLRKINTASFPVSYGESFYQDVLKRNNDNLNKFAYLKGNLVGAVCARLENENPRRVYILTLAVLAAYRNRGIGSQLLQSVLDYCDTQPVEEIALHVHISNDDALRFYTEKFGFTQGELVENYYRRIDPPHCYLVYKRIKAASSEAGTTEKADLGYCDDEHGAESCDRKTKTAL